MGIGMGMGMGAWQKTRWQADPYKRLIQETTQDRMKEEQKGKTRRGVRAEDEASERSAWQRRENDDAVEQQEEDEEANGIGSDVAGWRTCICSVGIDD
jgi:hypothetical protein